MDEPSLDDEPLGEGKGQGPGRRAALEHRLAGEVLRVQEEGLDEAAEVEKCNDVCLRDRPCTGVVLRSDGVSLVRQSIREHCPLLSGFGGATRRGTRGARPGSGPAHWPDPKGRWCQFPARRPGARGPGPWRRSARRVGWSCPRG